MNDNGSLPQPDRIISERCAAVALSMIPTDAGGPLPKEVWEALQASGNTVPTKKGFAGDTSVKTGTAG